MTAVWALLLSLTTAGEATAAATAGSGLISSTVCVSALTFGVILLTPTATISEYATGVVNSRMKTTET